MNAGAKGVKIICSGRLAGSEMARRETQKLGSIPLHTLDANVDYATATSRTTYGAIGVKVWIYKGKFGEVTEQAPRRRRRPPTRRIRSERRAGAVTNAVPAQGSKSTSRADVVALPTEADTKKQTTTEQNSSNTENETKKEN